MSGRTIGRWWAAVAVATVVAGCGRDDPARSAPPTIALAACRLKGVEAVLRCATLQVPEDRATDARTDRASRTIPIRIAVLPALARQPEADPVFVLAGGPGQAATEVAGPIQALFAKLNRNRDIVLIDQRGTGASNRLSCSDETGSASIASSFDATALDRAVARCASRLGQQADLTLYTTDIAVRDIDDVRARLGYARVNLWGASYGSRVALEYLRQFPDRVRTMTLDGVAPAALQLPLSFGVDTRSAIVRLIDACRLDAACVKRYPTFERDLAMLLSPPVDRAGSRRVDVTHPVTGKREPVDLTPLALATLLRTPLYIGLTASLLPDAVDRATHGDFGMLAAMSVTIGSGLEDGIALGMHLSVLCAEDMASITDADVERARERAVREPIAGRPNPFALVYFDQYRRYCAQWPVRRPPAAYFQSMLGRRGSDVPTLLLSGGIDPATPPRHASSIAAALPRAREAIAPNVGHGVSAQGCAPDLIERFVRSADAMALDVQCLDAIPRPLFLRPVVDARRDGDAATVP